MLRFRRRMTCHVLCNVILGTVPRTDYTICRAGDVTRNSLMKPDIWCDTHPFRTMTVKAARVLSTETAAPASEQAL
jgi:hypothetical protein